MTMVGLKEVNQCFGGFTALGEDRHALVFAMRNSFSIGKGDLMLDVMYIREPGACIYVGTEAQPLFF
jgi:hypothetical protein